MEGRASILITKAGGNPSRTLVSWPHTPDRLIFLNKNLIISIPCLILTWLPRTFRINVQILKTWPDPLQIPLLPLSSPSTKTQVRTQRHTHTPLRAHRQHAHIVTHWRLCVSFSVHACVHTNICMHRAPVTLFPFCVNLAFRMSGLNPSSATWAHYLTYLIFLISKIFSSSVFFLESRSIWHII